MFNEVLDHFLGGLAPLRFARRLVLHGDGLDMRTISDTLDSYMSITCWFIGTPVI